MAKTSIEWTATRLPDGTVLPGFSFNPWIGCSAISPGCAHCYAEALARRLRVKFGPGEVRRPAGDKYWEGPIKWNTQAAKAGIRRKVFCASMADVFDNEGLAAEREWLWELIEETPNLDWLLLTKRIGNVMGMIPERWLKQLPTHVWIGVTIVNQEEADRDIPKMLRIPAAVRFLSCEPLLGPISFVGRWVNHRNPAMHENWLEALSWVIVGGESGHGARAMHPDWVRSLRDQCVAVGTPFFMKQMGGTRNKRGAIEDLPEDLRVREFPRRSAT